jgi:hypothetical protein
MDDEIQFKKDAIGMKECAWCAVLTFWNVEKDAEPMVCRMCKQPFVMPEGQE